jgi:hypothetical protein
MRSLPMLSCAAVACACALAFGITLVEARPPQSSGTQPPARPLIGRVRTHDAILELTVDSVGYGGPAYPIGRGVAEVMADVERSARPTSGASAAQESLAPGSRGW